MTTVVARFAVSYMQLLNEHCEAAEELPAFAKDSAVCLELYRSMLLTRLFDKKAITLQRTGKMGTYAPINTQEAISTAIGHAMREDDVLVPYYRDYAAQFQRGVDMSDILAYWGGDERGSDFTNNRIDFPMSVPIASQCLHAAGVAFSFRYRKQDRVAVVCLGDGGTSEGDFYEALNVSGLWKLPVVFVVNNNQWAISVPLSQQTACETLAQKAVAAGFEGIQGDGNDVFTMRKLVGDAIEKARRGDGPTLIEAITYRLSDHTTADDATRYQSATEVSDAKTKEPLIRLKQFLKQHHQWDDEKDARLTTECSKEVQDAVDRYLARDPQPVSSMFDYMYAELPSYLMDQRAEAMEEESNYE